eukprot:5097477-Amphidinium_carterae.1
MQVTGACKRHCCMSVACSVHLISDGLRRLRIKPIGTEHSPSECATCRMGAEREHKHCMQGSMSGIEPTRPLSFAFAISLWWLGSVITTSG